MKLSDMKIFHFNQWYYRELKTGHKIYFFPIHRNPIDRKVFGWEITTSNPDCVYPEIPVLQDEHNWRRFIRSTKPRTKGGLSLKKKKGTVGNVIKVPATPETQI